MKLPIAALLCILLFSCSSPEDKAAQYRVQSEESGLAHSGKALLKSQCLHCHSSSAGAQLGRVAPPMIEIKATYLEKYPSEADFVAAVLAFTSKPEKEKALLQDAVKQFGLMPYQKYPEESVRQIAEYIYRYQIEAPEWFAASWKEKGLGDFVQTGIAEGTAVSLKDYAAIGLEYATAAKELLGKNLLGAIQSKGTAYALEFCNVQAMPLTDSIARVHQAEIRRVSDKNRNPKNAATREEVVILKNFQADIDAGREPQPVLKQASGKVHFYYPIVTNSMCLSCHGTEKDIAPAVAKRIIEFYPMDKATGYAENQVRGIWSITFKQ
jgi:nitrate reductase cytochrome c-type subunit